MDPPDCPENILIPKSYIICKYNMMKNMKILIFQRRFSYHLSFLRNLSKRYWLFFCHYYYENFFAMNCIVFTFIKKYNHTERRIAWMRQFNEDTRVKIPATIQFMRIGYAYQSLKDINYHSGTRILLDRFKKSIEKS